MIGIASAARRQQRCHVGAGEQGNHNDDAIVAYLQIAMTRYVASNSISHLCLSKWCTQNANADGRKIRADRQDEQADFQRRVAFERSRRQRHDQG